MLAIMTGAKMHSSASSGNAAGQGAIQTWNVLYGIVKEVVGYAGITPLQLLEGAAAVLFLLLVLAAIMARKGPQQWTVYDERSESR